MRGTYKRSLLYAGPPQVGAGPRPQPKGRCTMKGLVLHAGANLAARDDVARVTTPDPEGIWVPIPHLVLHDLITETLTANGHVVAEDTMGLWRDGQRIFGLLAIQDSTLSDFRIVVGWRNSHDKTFPAALVLGTEVFVC